MCCAANARQSQNPKNVQVLSVIICELGLSDFHCVCVKGGAWLCPNAERCEGGRTDRNELVLMSC